MTVTDAQVAQWLSLFFWPFLRVGAMFMASPIYNTEAIPSQLKVLLTLYLTLLIMPLLPEIPVVPLFSPDAVLIGLQQILIGVTIGMTLQIVFAALVFGGQTIAYSMGLGFATMVDAASGMQTPVISQIFVILGTLAFLLLNGHLILIRLVVESFHTLPVAIDGISRNDIWDLLRWSSRLFEAGLHMALPTLSAVFLMMLALGVLTRAAPQLNIFSIGFPMGILMGLVLIWITIPAVLGNFQEFIDEAFALVRYLLKLDP